MFSYIRERKYLQTFCGAAAGAYIARKYLVERLEDARENIERERTARDSYVTRLPRLVHDILTRLQAQKAVSTDSRGHGLHGDGAATDAG